MESEEEPIGMVREAWEWSDETKELLYFVYRFWLDERRPPNMGDIFRATGFDGRRARRLCRQLQEGFAVTFDDDRVNLALDKVPPFSATPTTVSCFLEGEFVSYIGCPMEAITVGWLPMIEHRVLSLRSYCACCYEPIELEVRRGELLSCSPVEPVIAAIRSPWDHEHGVKPDRVCDSYHYALDEAHARRFEERLLRRGVVVRFDQAQAMARSAAEGRMRDPHWKAIRSDGQATIDSWIAVGVDVSPWL